MSESKSPAVTKSSVSDKEIWATLRTRVDTIRGEEKAKVTTTGSEAKKRLRNNSELLIRGFDSISSSLSQLTGILDATAQGVRDLAKPPLILQDGILPSPKEEEEEEEERGGEGDEEPKPKRQCFSHNENRQLQVGFVKENESSKHGKLDIAKKLAISMATKAASLARELKIVKSELGFLQDRCNSLEEENKRFKAGFRHDLHDAQVDDGDDLVRLQLESLLADKSRLANENAAIIRENRCLHQLVEYHQMAAQELDFSQYGSDVEEEVADIQNLVKAE